LDSDPVRQIGDTSVEAGRGPGQLPWYRYAALHVTPGKNVLDVGTGLGLGLPILRETARSVLGQDIDPRLAANDITICELSEFSSKSFDIITCIDVIEHISDDTSFLSELQRVASQAIFITTPNWTASRCKWPFHIREYTPRQFRTLLYGLGNLNLYKGTPSGSEVWPIVNRDLYDLMNDLRINPLTSFPMRAIGKLLPRSWRIQSHNAALVHLY
jgi:SAM-dependent methyltransferase